jgi:hypothetical protein
MILRFAVPQLGRLADVLIRAECANTLFTERV